MRLYEIEAERRIPRLWLGPRNEIVNLDEVEESHASIVFNEPERFGLTPEMVADSLNDDTGELEYDWLIATTEANGWVRISTDVSNREFRGKIPAVSARDARGIHRGIRWLESEGFRFNRVEIDIETVIAGGKDIRHQYFNLSGDALYRFKRRGILS